MTTSVPAGHDQTNPNFNVLSELTKGMRRPASRPSPCIAAQQLPQFEINASQGAQRSAALPYAPTMAEAGLPGHEVEFWYGPLAPKAAPRPIVERLSAEVEKAMKGPEMAERLPSQGAMASYSPPDAFDAFIKLEVSKYATLVKVSGASSDG